jgi:hypothetical protein
MAVDFGDTTKLYARYLRALRGQSALPCDFDLAGEVETRLRQLDFILARVDKLDRARIEYVSRPDPDVPSDGSFLRSNAFEVRLFTEAFYYFAARLRTILRHKDKPCPLLHAFESPGVRDVRNKLLEHPEGRDSRVFACDWTVGSADGPMLKIHREPNQVFPDRGLYVNAKEFRDNLEAVLQRALASIHA